MAEGTGPTELTLAGDRPRISVWSVAVGLLGGLLATVVVVNALSIASAGDIGIDFVYYRDLGQRFLDTGAYYLPYQLEGPYDITLMADVLYPPSALLLFVPFVWLPAVLWWVVPVGVTVYVIAGWRPRMWAIAGMLVLLIWPRANGAFLFGNTDMWAMAGVAAGLRWGWPAILLTLKPTFAPFALVGIRHRSWWIAAAALAVVAILTASMWRDYVTAMANLRAPLEYSVGSLPLLFVPIVAWLGRSPRQADPGPSKPESPGP